ncbi:relaxase/mobilization nuclease domain-containing protein [Chroococcidiopsis sp. CCNUC1]|uniref:relaxase/mobilization nuclease domain-containing protein n=1 Tax=Chroococcidiopsis sp. CCNUC1 TaxID=2653189 RepID=UPI002020DAA8|nr:relaxase/mobilization nuclease domain-containing protein [Chroococcidiopsis sp. CCNUC1]URD53581.1 relaxase/mobilization nuclease domain-containing protein [Chroococcidiopsis sp. CCNUC1]
MIGKNYKHASFWGTLAYVLNEKKNPVTIATNMMGTTPAQLAAQLRVTCDLNPNVQRTCIHIILSLPDRDGYRERLEDKQYAEISKRYLQAMGFVGEGTHECQWLVVRHDDANNAHIHIVASRVRMDGTTVNDSWDWWKSQVAIRKLEQEYGLEILSCSNSQVAAAVKKQHGIETGYTTRRAPSIRQKHHTSNQKSLTQQFAQIIDDLVATSPTVSQFIQRLEREHDITVLPKFSGDRFMSGFSYSKDGWQIAGYSIGSNYTFPKLIQRGLFFDPIEDMPAIVAARHPQLTATEGKKRRRSNVKKQNVEAGELTISLTSTEIASGNGGKGDRYDAVEDSPSQVTVPIVSAQIAEADLVEISHQMHETQFSDNRRQQTTKTKKETEIPRSHLDAIAQSDEGSSSNDTCHPTPCIAPTPSYSRYSTIVTAYLLTLNTTFFSGNRYSAQLDNNILTLTRNSNGEQLLKTAYTNGQWQEIEATQLTQQDATILDKIVPAIQQLQQQLKATKKDVDYSC